MSWKESLYRKAVALKSGTEHLVYGRPILREWAVGRSRNLGRPLRILDVGCGQGDDLLSIREALGGTAELYALESYPPYRAICESKGIEVRDADVERDRLPFDDGFLDAVLMNQVLEHTKDLFWIFSEVGRVLPAGGVFLVGVPNLAAWHDRAMLAAGMQPSGMKVLGPHVRGFTVPGLRAFAEADGYFRVTAVRGSGFYPFPAFLAIRLARWFPTLATGIFLRIERTQKPGTFLDVLRSRMYETAYYQGPAS
jgi:SAM-dependent methyltransferase